MSQLGGTKMMMIWDSFMFYMVINALKVTIRIQANILFHPIPLAIASRVRYYLVNTSYCYCMFCSGSLYFAENVSSLNMLVDNSF